MGLSTTLRDDFNEEKKITISFSSKDYDYKRQSENITKIIGAEAFAFINDRCNLRGKGYYITSTNTLFNILKVREYQYRKIINIKKINDTRYVNKFFEAVNSKLEKGGVYIGLVETYATRRKRVLKKFPRPFNWLYYVIDVVFMRIFPKLPIAKHLYFFMTGGRNRILTRAETFGRLYSCGFEVLEEEIINNKLYFVTRKIKEPAFDLDPTYGLFIKLKRVGKNGKLFNVYKLRTMHAYAEYLQDYVHQHNKLKKGGKFKNDFRITHEGKIFRRLWIDEYPMLLNLLKGNMKLVGVRPLSKQYFGLYSKELQEKRIKYKPGLIPPFYADMPKNLEEIMASEMRYLDAYEKSPFLTDVTYFFKVFKNIFIKGKRSS